MWFIVLKEKWYLCQNLKGKLGIPSGIFCGLTCVCTDRARTAAESHLFPTSQNRVQQKFRVCLKMEEKTQTVLSLDTLHGSFTVWAIGIMPAHANFIVEISTRTTGSRTRQERKVKTRGGSEKRECGLKREAGVEMRKGKC